jgi:hypothetical protein
MGEQGESKHRQHGGAERQQPGLLWRHRPHGKDTERPALDPMLGGQEGRRFRRVVVIAAGEHLAVRPEERQPHAIRRLRNHQGGGEGGGIGIGPQPGAREERGQCRGLGRLLAHPQAAQGRFRGEQGREGLARRPGGGCLDPPQRFRLPGEQSGYLRGRGAGALGERARFHAQGRHQAAQWQEGERQQHGCQDEERRAPDGAAPDPRAQRRLHPRWHWQPLYRSAEAHFGRLSLARQALRPVLSRGNLVP